MEKKWCLLKVSDGNRGVAGKKKIYEIVVKDNVVEFSWGMAEKANRQSSKLVTANGQYAMYEAKQKLWDKLASGYSLAYEV